MNKIKKSLVFQTSFLFFLSFLVIVSLWIFFYFQQKYQHFEYDVARYLNISNFLYPSLSNNKDIKDEELKLFDMTLNEQIDYKKENIVFHKGNEQQGFKIISFDNKYLVYIYNGNSSVFLEDISSHRSLVAIHLVFVLLLITQGLLYMKLQKSLSPLSLLHKKLKKLKVGDLSSLKIKSDYEEINQMIYSYNDSVSKIEEMLEFREMFNKIFMHEMKMPLAKGMFYLKQEPSKESHEKLNEILNNLNEELDEFSQIELLISKQNKIKKEKHDLLELLESAKNRAYLSDENVIIQNHNNQSIVGDKEFWILCFKNLLTNAVNYSYDKKVLVDLSSGICFENKGDELPVDISKDIKKWKIDKNKRHHSSTGYGFGLFIIKNIVTIHNRKLEYSYDKESSIVKLSIKYVSC